MKWFKHDSNASSDAKVKKLLIRHGAVGYAVYFHCIELITANLNESNLTFELEHDSEIIADNLKIVGTANESGIKIVEKIMRTIIELELFVENNDHILCLKLAKRLDSSMTSNPLFRARIKESHDSVMMQSCKNRLEETTQEEKKGEKEKKEEKKKEDLTGLSEEEYKLHEKLKMSEVLEELSNHKKVN